MDFANRNDWPPWTGVISLLLRYFRSSSKRFSSLRRQSLWRFFVDKLINALRSALSMIFFVHFGIFSVSSRIDLWTTSSNTPKNRPISIKLTSSKRIQMQKNYLRDICASIKRHKIDDKLKRILDTSESVNCSERNALSVIYLQKKNRKHYVNVPVYTYRCENNFICLVNLLRELLTLWKWNSFCFELNKLLEKSETRHFCYAFNKFYFISYSFIDN